MKQEKEVIETDLLVLGIFFFQCKFTLTLIASSQTTFIINYVTLIMVQDPPKHWFLSPIFLVPI